MSSVAKLFLLLTHGGSPIAGESQTKGYEKQIEIEDWSWNIRRAKDSGRNAPDKAEPSVLSFTKYMDRATTAMLAAAKTGDKLEAVFVLDEQTPGSFLLRLTLKGVQVIKYDMKLKLDKSSATIEEDWDFNYDTIEIDFYPPGTKPGMRGAVTTARAKRSPGASTASAGESKLIELAGQISFAELEQLRPKMEEAAKKFDLAKKNAPPPQQGATSSSSMTAP